MSVRRTLALAVGAVLLLAGCGGDPEPRFEPTPSPSPSESEASAEPEAQTPEEFIREWVRLHTEMQNTGQTDAFRSISEDCKACIDLADMVDDYYDAGGFVRTDGWTITSLNQRGRTGEAIEFEATIESAATVYAESAQAREMRLPAGTGVELFAISDASGAWQMLRIAEIAQ